jgi:hypothetical protein
MTGNRQCAQLGSTAEHSSHFDQRMTAGSAIGLLAAEAASV